MKNKNITLTNDTYTVLDALGKGGQANIWRVRRSDGVELAMKSVLTFKLNKNGHRESLDEATVNNNIKRLKTEIHFLKHLGDTEQRFIVPCLDDGVIKDARYGDLPTWVMPLYEQTLEYKMPPYPAGKLLPDFKECMRWAKQLATALEATHSFRPEKTAFVHRDVKASNMMLTESGDIRLIDFGIVHETTLEEETSTHSYSPESAAPEQVLASSHHARKNAYSMGPYSDMYALGTVIYRLFTGKSTNTQFKLKNQDTLADHFKILNENNTGLIGTIGGLDDDEYSDLYNEILLRLEEAEEDDATIVSSETPSPIPHFSGLPNHQHIAESTADFIRDLLHPSYSKRPNAQQMITWCNTIKLALSPELDTLELSSDQKNITLNTSPKLNISMQGKGLPANADWIKLSINGKPLSNTSYRLESAEASYGFLPSSLNHWSINLAQHNEIGALRLKVEAVVKGEMQTDSLTLQITDSADELWQQGEHQQALCIDLREAWLDELHQACDSFEAATQHSNLLKSLRKCHPNKEATILLRMQWLREKFSQKKPSSTNLVATLASKLSVKIVGIAALTILLAVVGLTWQSPTPDTKQDNDDISQLETALNSQVVADRLKAWKRLNLLSKTDNSKAAETLLTNFTQQTLDLAKSNDEKQQQEAIPRLQLMAKSGDKTAMIPLAKAYYEGKGTSLDWGSAWKWYQKANAKDKKQALENEANLLLHNKTSQPLKRKLAYQVVEKAAKYEAAGDPSQKWMEYRYRTGDGVPINKEKAALWLNIYNGTPAETNNGESQ